MNLYLNRPAWLLMGMLLALGAGGAWAEGKGASQTWTLKSGPIQYTLRQTAEGVECRQFGSALGASQKDESQKDEPPSYRPDLGGRVEGRALVAKELELVSARPATTARKDELLLTFRHRLLPLEITARYTAWGDTGVITRQLSLRNKGRHVLHVESLPALSWVLPAGGYELTTLQGSWWSERHVITEKLGAAAKRFESATGRSSAKMGAWFSLRSEKTGLRYLAQLAWSGNWQMSFARAAAADGRTSIGQELRVEMEPRFDGGGALVLYPGASVEMPAAAFTATSGDLDDAANALHRYQERYVIPRNPANEPPLVQFNSWYVFNDKVNLADLKRCVDAAAEIGAEAFVLDSGWYGQIDWSRELGDWRPDPQKFPRGTAELARYVHAKGLKFGLWVEIENIGDLSQIVRQHADWCFRRDGAAVHGGPRYHLNFAKPEVRAWARDTMDRLIRENKLDWVKIDYNVDIGDQFEEGDATRPGDVLYRHIQSYYGWLDELRAAHPKLIIENCASGGMRFDLGIIAHTHTTWISDCVLPKPSAQLAYGATLEFTPKICNHWMVGDEENGRVNLKNPPEWWDFMFRVPMNGQFGISSRVFEWSPELKQCAARNVALYKRLRLVIATGDCYHLTPAPEHENPTGWMALQYVAPDRARSVVLAYRLGKSPAQLTLKLRGLDPGRHYRLTRDGQAGGEFTGKQLGGEGVVVSLADEWRSTVIELERR